jgi:SAM-dependent methyltransferase
MSDAAATPLVRLRQRVQKAIDNPDLARAHLRYLRRTWYLRLWERPEAWAFDALNRIQTRGALKHEELRGVSSQDHATWYEAVEHNYLRMSVGYFCRRFGGAFHFVDIGCGEGRACFYAAPRFAEVTGVDFAPDLVERAQANLRTFRNRRNCPIRFEVADAAYYALPAQRSAVFLYNPFDEVVMRDFIGLNAQVLKQTNSFIVYVNDRQAHVLEDAGFALVHRRMRYLPVSIYSCGDRAGQG